MKKILCFLMFGFAFTAFQVVSVGADDAAQAEVDISHCADLPPTTRPSCEAAAHAGPPGGPGGPGHHPPGSMPPGDPMCFDAATQTSIPCSSMPGADASMTPPPSSHPGGPGGSQPLAVDHPCYNVDPAERAGHACWASAPQ